MEATELIERYVYQVGQQLPRKKQADIQLELRSLLHDTLEERAAAAGKEPTEKMVADILHEFGRPETMAAQYRPERYLIGPKLFPHFLFTIRLVSAVFAVVFVVLFAIPLLTESGYDNILLYAWNLLIDLGGNLLFSVGVILAIFAAIEYYIDPDELEESATVSEWDPLTLPQVVEESARIKRGELIFGVVMGVLMIVLFNLYPEKIGYFNTIGDGAVVLPLFAQEFFVHVPWLTASWIMDIVLKLAVLRNGRWTPITRWMEFAFALFGLYVLYRIVNGGPILTIAGLTTLVRFALRIAMVVTVVDLLVKLYRLLFKRPSSPNQTFKSRIA